MQVLLEVLKIAEHERLILLDRAAQRGAKLIARKARHGRAIEEVPRVEVVVPDELIERAVELIRSLMS